MKCRRKKKGSSLIFAVIIFMVVVTVSVGMLSMVAGNYKARAIESKRVENLYGADSGLDAAYNVIAKTVDNANKYGYEKVEEFKKDSNNFVYSDLENCNDITKEIKKFQAYMYILNADIDYQKNENKNNTEKIKRDNDYINIIINHVFRYYFKEYINGAESESLISNVQGVKTEDNIQNGMYKYNGDQEAKLSYNGASIDFKEDSIEIDDKGNSKLTWHNITEDTYEVNQDKLVKKYWYVKNTDEDGNAIYELKTETADIDSGEYYSDISATIDLISNFEEYSNIGSNKRSIEAKYNLVVPNYDEVTFEKSIESDTDELPGLTVGGNLTVDQGDLDVYGDIMVEGENDDSDTVATKYNGGIKINSDNTTTNNTVNFYNNVYCRKTFNVVNNVDVNIGKDLYAGNIYINSTNQNRGSYLGVKGDSKLIKYNNDNIPYFDDNYNQADDNNKVVINNDFEMNAYKANVDITNFYGINSNNINNSKSSQVLNSSSIIINNNDDHNRNSYLVIEKDAYISGVAHINTNTPKGYQTGESVAVKGNYNAYSVPLNTDDKFIDQDPLQLLDTDDLNKKIAHFHDYWLNNLPELDTGGVIFGDFNKVHALGDIVYKDKDGNREVKSGGAIEDTGLLAEQSDFAKNIYSFNIPEDNKGKNKKYKSSPAEEDIDKISDIITDEDVSNLPNDIKYYKSDIKISDVNLNGNNRFKGILIVNGNLTIDTNCEITGDMIITGDVKIENGTKLTLKYDRDLTRNIQNENLVDIKSIFKENYGKDKEVTDDLDNNDSMVESNSTNFIKSGIWTIRK